MKCARSSQIIFDQIVNILDQIEESDYCASLPIFNGSTVGKHVRHILDFYQCILKSSARGELDYSDRDRSPSVEKQTTLAKNRFLELQGSLEQLDETELITVFTDFFPDDELARLAVHSSIGRELMYAYDHAVHHLAIIKIGIKTSFSYIRIGEHIGVAPSTIKYESSQKTERT